MNDQAEAVETAVEAAPAVSNRVNTVERSAVAGFVASNLIVKTRQPAIIKFDEAGEPVEVDSKVQENVLLGAIPYCYPTLDCVFEGFPAPDGFIIEMAEAIPEEFEGFEVVTPVYNDAKLQYLQDALRVAVENPIRAGKTIEKDELGLVSDWKVTKAMVDAWPTILEVSRGSGYPYMSEKADATALFKDWLASTKLKPAQQETLVKVFRSPETVANMSPALKAGLEKTVSIWTGLLGTDEEGVPLTEKFSRHLAKIAEGLEADVMDDFDSFEA